MNLTKRIEKLERQMEPGAKGEGSRQLWNILVSTASRLEDIPLPTNCSIKEAAAYLLVHPGDETAHQRLTEAASSYDHVPKLYEAVTRVGLLTRQHNKINHRPSDGRAP